MKLINFSERIKDWFLRNHDNKYVPHWLFIISFTESSFFPIPPDPFLAASLMIKQNKWLFYSVNVIVGSVLGALFGYLVGYWFFEIFGGILINTYSLQDEFVIVSEMFQDHAFLTMFTAAFTPIPFKLFTLSAGLFKVNIFVFLIASIIGRGIRFLMIGLIMKNFGKKIGEIVFRYFNLCTSIFALGVVFYLIFKFI